MVGNKLKELLEEKNIAGGACRLTEFGREVRFALIDLGKSQKWLIDQVRAKTGCYIDHSYLRRILTGKCDSKKMKKAISDILELGVY